MGKYDSLVIACSSQNHTVPLICQNPMMHQVEQNYEHTIMHNLALNGFVRLTDQPTQNTKCGCMHKSKSFKISYVSPLGSGTAQAQHPLTIDIIANNGADTIGIEVKLIKNAHNSKFPLHTRNYDFIYGFKNKPNYKIRSINYTFPSPPSNASWIWQGGPYIKDPNGKIHPTFFQEGQLWWDIVRLKKAQSNLGLTSMYLVGYIDLSKGYSLGAGPGGTNIHCIAPSITIKLDELIRAFSIHCAGAGGKIYTQHNGALQEYDCVSFGYKIVHVGLISSNMACYLAEIF